MQCEKVKISTNSLNVVIKSWGILGNIWVSPDCRKIFHADAINTLISGLLAVYLVEEAGLTPADSQNILALAIAFPLLVDISLEKLR